jgi:hypothetical protein
MKGYIKGRLIILLEDLPNNLKDGDRVEVSLSRLTKSQGLFPTFKLGVKDEYLDRDKIYDRD